ncbi:MAG: hypothetical protein ACFCU3_02355 [Verrucomicrobiales bacterium]
MAHLAPGDPEAAYAGLVENPEWSDDHALRMVRRWLESAGGIQPEVLQRLWLILHGDQRVAVQMIVLSEHAPYFGPRLRICGF